MVVRVHLRCGRREHNVDVEIHFARTEPGGATMTGRPKHPSTFDRVQINESGETDGPRATATGAPRVVTHPAPTARTFVRALEITGDPDGGSCSIDGVCA